MIVVYFAFLFIVIGFLFYCKSERRTLLMQLYERNNQIEADAKKIEELSKSNTDLQQQILSLELQKTLLENWKKEREDALVKFKKERLYNKFHSPIAWTPTENDWNILIDSIDQSNPDFMIALQCVDLNEMERKMCYLGRIGVKPSAMAILLHLENASVYRKRLYEKLTGSKGGAKEFDEYISNL